MVKRCFCLILLALLMTCRVQAEAVDSTPLGEEGGLEEVPEGWLMLIFLGDETKCVTIPKGCAIANLWEPETVGGSKFLYWTPDIFDAEEDREVITKDTVFYEDLTLYPVTEDTSPEAEDFSKYPSGDYTPLPEPEPSTADPNCYYIHFHTCNGEPDTWTFDVPKDKPIGRDMVEVIDSIEPNYINYDFIGWYTAEEGGEKVEFTKKTVITSDMDVYAHWERVVNYEVTYMRNYGKEVRPYALDGYREPLLIDICTISRKGYKFLGWYTKPKGGKQMKEGDTLTSASITLYAHWKKVKVDKVSINRLFGKNKAVTVKYRKQKGVKGYQIQASVAKGFPKKKTITRTYKSNKVFTRTIKKLKKGTLYYVRIRAFKKDSTGARVYGKWSKVKKIKTK